MTWAKLDDGFPNNPKVKRLTIRAKWLQVVALCYCARNLTDGALDDQAVRVVLAEADVPKRHVEELHHAGLWNRAGNGYLINDYLEYNPSGDEVRESRRLNAERQKRFRERNPNGTYKTASNDVSNGPRNALRNTSPSRPVEVKTLGETGAFRAPKMRQAGAA